VDYARGYTYIGEVQSQQSYQTWLAHSMKPPAREMQLAAPIEAPAPVKFADIKAALSKPHILVLGETGSGKSTLVKYLVSHASAPSIVLDSHAAPDDWQGMNVIGMGRNYKAIAEEVDRLVELMDSRYEARGNGQKQFEPLLVLIDEFPAAAATLGKKFTEQIMLIVREARKVQIRLIILSQGSEVKSLGIEGQGSIRECFAIVSLGKFASDRAKSLKDDQVKTFIAAAQFPAMLDDLPCELPKIDRVNLPQLPMPKDYKTVPVDSVDVDNVDTDLDLFDVPKRLSTPVNSSTVDKLSTGLSTPLEAIVNYAKKQNTYITARQAKQNIRIFRDTDTKEIRQYFQWLADKNHGVTRGADENLEFSAA
jgi:ABC-type cobalamin/Fe3+-siderophores transport system ATPase subunit